MSTLRTEPNIIDRPTLTVAVVMRREPIQGPMSQWQNWRWTLADVVPHDQLPELAAAWQAGELAGPLPIEPVDQTGQADTQHWLFPGFAVELFRDDAEGYYLNLTSPQPCFWVLWRLDQEAAEDAMPEPLVATLSYHDAGRWLDVQERVDQVPAPAAVVSWLESYTTAHYRPEPKQRRRPTSFQPLSDRFGQPVRISTDKRRGDPGGSHGG